MFSILIGSIHKPRFFVGSKVCYAEPQNLTDRVRDALQDRKPLPPAENTASQEEGNKSNKTPPPSEEVKQERSNWKFAFWIKKKHESTNDWEKNKTLPPKFSFFFVVNFSFRNFLNFESKFKFV